MSSGACRRASTACSCNYYTRFEPHAGTGGLTPPVASLDFDWEVRRWNGALNSVFAQKWVNQLTLNYMNTDRLFGKRANSGPLHVFPSVSLGGNIGGGFEDPNYWSLRACRAIRSGRRLCTASTSAWCGSSKRVVTRSSRASSCSTCSTGGTSTRRPTTPTWAAPDSASRGGRATCRICRDRCSSESGIRSSRWSLRASGSRLTAAGVVTPSLGACSPKP